MLTKSIKVLVVEDDPFLSKVYQSSFSASGYVMDYAHDGHEALEHMRTFRPDIVLLDLVMPRQDGFEVLELMQQDVSLAGIKVVVLTNLGQPEDKAKCLSLGAVDYLVKTDIAIMDLVAKVKEYVG
ncbi:MAG: response regulator [Candidatus Komeilibacteria bacterium]